MSWTKQCLRQLSVAEIDVRTCKAQASSFLSLKSFNPPENMECTLAKDPIISSFSTALHSEWRQLEVFHGRDVQFDGGFLQEGQKLCEREWLARTLKNKMWESVSVQEDMFELRAHTFHSNFRLLAFIFTSLLLLFVYLFL
jgi:hypothetical protein